MAIDPVHLTEIYGASTGGHQDSLPEKYSVIRLRGRLAAVGGGPSVEGSVCLIETTRVQRARCRQRPMTELVEIDALLGRLTTRRWQGPEWQGRRRSSGEGLKTSRLKGPGFASQERTGPRRLKGGSRVAQRGRPRSATGQMS